MILPTCKEAARAAAEGALEEGPSLKRLLLRAHLWHCEVCSSFLRQIQAVGRAFRERFGASLPPPARLELESRILKKLVG